MLSRDGLGRRNAAGASAALAFPSSWTEGPAAACASMATVVRLLSTGAGAGSRSPIARDCPACGGLPGAPEPSGPLTIASTADSHSKTADRMSVVAVDLLPVCCKAARYWIGRPAVRGAARRSIGQEASHAKSRMDDGRRGRTNGRAAAANPVGSRYPEKAPCPLICSLRCTISGRREDRAGSRPQTP